MPISFLPFFLYQSFLFLSLLPPKTAPLSQPSFTTGGLAEHGTAATADDDGLGVREDCCDGEAAGAFYVHEEGAGGGDEGLGVENVSVVEGLG